MFIWGVKPTCHVSNTLKQFQQTRKQQQTHRERRVAAYVIWNMLIKRHRLTRVLCLDRGRAEVITTRVDCRVYTFTLHRTEQPLLHPSIHMFWRTQHRTCVFSRMQRVVHVMWKQAVELLRDQTGFKQNNVKTMMWDARLLWITVNVYLNTGRRHLKPLPADIQPQPLQRRQGRDTMSPRDERLNKGCQT